MLRCESKCQCFWRPLWPIAIAILLVCGCDKLHRHHHSTAPRKTSAAPLEKSASKLATGIYLVNRWTIQRNDLDPLFDYEHFVEYREDDYLALQEDEPEPVKYLALHRTEFVPMELAADPARQQGTDGRAEVSLTFSDEMTNHLTEFSREYLGRQVALVIDGDVVTIHKVRSVITGNGLQISRCTDDGCELILARLKK